MKNIKLLIAAFHNFHLVFLYFQFPGNTGVSTDSPLFEWFSVLSSLLKVHYRHNGVNSECRLIDLEYLLSSLNYILFYLIKVKGVSVTVSKWKNFEIYLGFLLLPHTFIECTNPN